ncbi:hypothetical protein ACIO6T_45155 [Streptomyces sp. NPDC087532]|uniref:hypothetical protein n=1 Tax=Streptomyces sp. NPDC087532 TaxID=3365795 RepID=UPI00380BEF20
MATDLGEWAEPEMTGDRPRVVIERLHTINWSDDSAAYEHANSRALLMREYLRRAARWAQAYGVEKSWPFFDIAEHVAPEVRTPSDVAAELEKVLTGLAPSSLERSAGAPFGGPCCGAPRHRVDDDRMYDEAFTRNLRWQPIEYLRLYVLGHNEVGHVPITEIEAAAFIESTTKRLIGS